MKPDLRSRRGFSQLRAILLAVASLLLTYILAGSYLAPYLIEQQIKDSATSLGFATSIELVRFNPITLNLQLTQLTFANADKSQTVSIKQIQASGDIASIFERPWIFVDAMVDTPQIEIGTSHLSAKTRQALEATLSKLQIGHLQVHHGELRVAPSMLGLTADARLVVIADVELEIDQFGVPATPAQFALRAAVNGSSPITSQGSFTPIPLTLDALVKVTDLDGSYLTAFMDPPLEFEHFTVTAAVDGRIRVAQDLGTFAGRFDLIDASLAGAEQDAGSLSVAAVQGTGVVVDADSGWTIAGLRLEKPVLLIQVDGSDPPSKPSFWDRVIDEFGKRELNVRQIEIQQGSALFTHMGFDPPISVQTSNLTASLAHEDSAFSGSLEGTVNGDGRASVSFRTEATDSVQTADINLDLSAVDLSIISPWLEQVLGRSVQNGRITLASHYHQAGENVKTDNHMVIEHLTLANDARLETTLPDLDLIVALLEDDSGQIEFALPISYRGSGLDLSERYSRALREFAVSVARAPFLHVGAPPGDAARDLGKVGFLDGSTAVTAAGASNLQALTQAMQRRPRIGLHVVPGYHPIADRDALAHQQVKQHIALATSSGPTGPATRDRLDLDDDKVISILDEFAGARLPKSELAEIGRRFTTQASDYYQAVYQALVTNEPVSVGALERVARYRGRAIRDALVAHGIDGERVDVCTCVEAAPPDESASVRLEPVAWQSSPPRSSQASTTFPRSPG